MLAVQAQDYPAAQWAIGVRSPGTTLDEVQASVNAGDIVRSWPMRGTLHLVRAGAQRADGFVGIRLRSCRVSLEQ